MIYVFIIYLIVINLIAFALYGIDKYKAAHNKWRIPESVLIGVAVLGGGVGALLGMYVWHHKTKKWKFKICVPLFLIIWVVLLGGFLIYAEDYYRADQTALNALQSDSEVAISKTDYGWFFDGPSDTDALIFYPGAKVEETAYAPLLHKLATAGIDVCLVSMPLRIAMLDPDKADEVIREYNYDHWYIGGHSLGGYIASNYSASHDKILNGLILLGAFTIEKQSDNLNAILISGSNDQVLNKSLYEKGLGNVSKNAKILVIDGGNHAQFGSYGPQDGDGTPGVSQDEQADKTVDFIIESIKRGE